MMNVTAQRVKELDNAEEDKEFINIDNDNDEITETDESLLAVLDFIKTESELQAHDVMTAKKTNPTNPYVEENFQKLLRAEIENNLAMQKREVSDAVESSEDLKQNMCLEDHNYAFAPKNFKHPVSANAFLKLAHVEKGLANPQHEGSLKVEVENVYNHLKTQLKDESFSNACSPKRIDNYKKPLKRTISPEIANKQCNENTIDSKGLLKIRKPDSINVLFKETDRFEGNADNYTKDDEGQLTQLKTKLETGRARGEQQQANINLINFEYAKNTIDTLQSTNSEIQSLKCQTAQFERIQKQRRSSTKGKSQNRGHFISPLNSNQSAKTSRCSESSKITERQLQSDKGKSVSQSKIETQKRLNSLKARANLNEQLSSSVYKGSTNRSANITFKPTTCSNLRSNLITFSTKSLSKTNLNSPTCCLSQVKPLDSANVFRPNKSNEERLAATNNLTNVNKSEGNFSFNDGHKAKIYQKPPPDLLMKTITALTKNSCYKKMRPTLVESSVEKNRNESLQVINASNPISSSNFQFASQRENVSLNSSEIASLESNWNSNANSNSKEIASQLISSAKLFAQSSKKKKQVKKKSNFTEIIEYAIRNKLVDYKNVTSIQNNEDFDVIINLYNSQREGGIKYANNKRARKRISARVRYKLKLKDPMFRNIDANESINDNENTPTSSSKMDDIAKTPDETSESVKPQSPFDKPPLKNALYFALHSGLITSDEFNKCQSAQENLQAVLSVLNEKMKNNLEIYQKTLKMRKMIVNGLAKYCSKNEQDSSRSVNNKLELAAFRLNHLNSKPKTNILSNNSPSFNSPTSSMDHTNEQTRDSLLSEEEIPYFIMPIPNYGQTDCSAVAEI
ncbi:uncharacterized protein LOC119642649 [Glossina fuscipes]|uniref:Uncharacterized protein LOC119642649 n=1 Tax=Glossina fuscipes TaxID=7396 RepID=A0A9C5ZDY1_9MUSC|nr:uncharacterized protein LOC119642649 [Glossina fuscipes]XP_037897808.1 uncharacterized protein LOC119642649 [Glossina fuscipes]KAI9589554.1 hypothetical protein GQX74_007722 [Glossina fuscipes]